MLTTTTTRTKYTVVFIHGVFSWGPRKPLWNRWTPCLPEAVLAKLNPNHRIPNLGFLSSEHDSACEAFYQLYGGRVDYGEQHSCEAGHKRYGETHDIPLHPNWSAANPVHLVGHSFGARTQIELYQLLCADFFGVGSDHRWVASIVSIGGPLSGSTMNYKIGIEDGKMTTGGILHVMLIAFSLWFKLYSWIPALKGACDLGMDQWGDVSLRELLSIDGRVNQSRDTGLHGTVPERCMARNAQWKHMDKPYLLSITTSPKIGRLPIKEVLAGVVLGMLHLWPAEGQWLVVKALVGALLLSYVWTRLNQMHLDRAQIPSLYVIQWFISLCAKEVPPIANGLIDERWRDNDGMVNIHSMLRPWFPTSKQLDTGFNGEATRVRSDSHVSIDEFDAATENEHPQFAQRFEKGQWHVQRVDANHYTGTYWDSGATDLYRDLFTLIATKFELEDTYRPAHHKHIPSSPMVRNKSALQRE